jgi:hypothetical protein
MDRLPAGTYSLEVVHAYESTGWSRRQALVTEVTVP